MDIRPPKNWRQPQRQAMPAARPSIPVSQGPAPIQASPPTLPRPVSQAPTPAQSVVAPPDIPKETSDLTMPLASKPRRKLRRWIFVILFSLLGLLIATVVAAIMWYGWAVSAPSTNATKSEFIVKNGETPSIIAKHLEELGLVRSALAFEVYARLHNQADSLRAGSYKLSPNQSVADIISRLTKGQDGVYNVLIPPGLTLKQLADSSIKGSFASQGFSADEIQSAFAASYTSPLLADKPAGASLEGYIFPETFQVREGDSLQSVLERSFDELYAKLQQDGMIAKFAVHGLNLHQALTLGSIIQKETSVATVQSQVAQVFLSRLSIGMPLGSDVTFIYAARQMGVQPTPDLASPYNTRIHTGLPPGPIATMNYSALQAVADPSQGDFLYFVAGDDGTVHFSRTYEEHQSQVQQFCQKLCSEAL